MKKLFSIAVVTIMAATLSACGAKSDSAPTSKEVSTKDILDEMSDEEIQELLEQRKEEKSEPDTEIGQDFDSDVKNGLLFVDMNGRIVDKDNNFIEAYSDIYCTADRHLMCGEDAAEGYAVNEDMQIVLDEEYIAACEEYSEQLASQTYLDRLQALASPDMAEVKVPVADDSDEYNLNVYNLVDLGSPYYPQIVYGCWWVDGINGTVPAGPNEDATVSLPKNLGSDIFSGGNFDTSTDMEDFKLIDQDTCTIEQITRSGPDKTCYAFYIENINKGTSASGTSYFNGYVDNEFVAVEGKFSTLKNGDNVFVYGNYIGMNDDDIPIFNGEYLEFVN